MSGESTYLLRDGEIVAVELSGYHITCKVISIDKMSCTLRRLDNNGVLHINNWVKAQIGGKFIFHRRSTTDIEDPRKTIPIKKYVRQRPGLFKRWWYRITDIKLERIEQSDLHVPATDRKGKRILVEVTVYQLTRMVTGVLFKDGWFIPHPYQCIRHPLYFPHYDKTKAWNQTDNKN